MGENTEETADDPVTLDAASTALIVVDMQNDFAHEDGALFVEDAPETIPRIAEVVRAARDAGAHVVFTQDWHDEDDPEFSIWPRHAVADSWGARIVEELAPREDETRIQKLRYDAFYGTSLDHRLSLWGVDTVMIAGTVANICVLHTAGSAALRWYDVIVLSDCVSALRPSDLEATQRQVEFLYGGQWIDSSLLDFCD